MIFIPPAWLVRSRHFFRHPYWLCHLSSMSSVICHQCHKWHIMQMTDDISNRSHSWYGCLKKGMDPTSEAGSIKVIANVFLKHKHLKYHSENFLFIDFVNPLYFRARKQVVWWDLNISPINLIFFCVSHSPREWDKTLAKNIWKLFFVRPILGHPNLCPLLTMSIFSYVYL